MYRFIESIKLKDGKFYLLPLHQQRMQRTTQELLGVSVNLNLEQLALLAKNHAKGLYKCRILYSHVIEKVEIIPYQPRPIYRLKVLNGRFNYTYKYENRHRIKELFAQKGDADDIIISQQGFVTDSSYANLAFYDGTTWWTPSTPLLKGVQRQFLLSQQLIQEKPIPVATIVSYKKVKLFNALLDWAIAPIVDVENISTSQSTFFQ